MSSFIITLVLLYVHLVIVTHSYPDIITLASGLISCDHTTDEALDFTSNISVYFYDSDTKTTVNYSLTEAVKSIPALSYYNPNKKHIFYFHGFDKSFNTSDTQYIYNALSDLTDINAIFFDFAGPVDLPSSGLLSAIKAYKSVVKNAYYITNNTYSMVKSLLNAGLVQSNMHIVGHSLGGHMAGILGDLIYDRTGVKVSRVTGLDPAGPCYQNSKTKLKLTKNSGDYVDVIHCNANQFGTNSNSGHADFYANCDGTVQPGCSYTTVPIQKVNYALGQIATCSHDHCPLLYSNTMANSASFTAYQCNSYDNFIDGNCSGNQQAIAGYYSNSTAAGEYYFCSTGTCTSCSVRR